MSDLPEMVRLEAFPLLEARVLDDQTAPATQYPPVRTGRFLISDRIISAVGGIAAVIGAVLLALDLSVIFLSVIARYFFHSPFGWSDEVARAILIALAFFGGTIALARREHVGISLVVDRLPSWSLELTKAFRVCLVTAFAAAFVWTAWQVLPITSQDVTASGLSTSVFYWPMLIAGIGMVVISAAELLCLRLLPLLAAAGTLVGVTVGWWLFAGYWETPTIMPIIFLVLVFALSLALAVPIGFALGIGAMVFVMANGSIPPALVATRMEAGVDSFVLLAVPFFIFAGLLMDSGGVSAHLIDLVRLALGRVRGGLGVVTIVSMYLFSGISGSKTGDIAAVGSLMLPAYRERKQEAEGLALLAASAAMGETIPPSIALLILASLANLSVAALFLAGILPAAVIALGLAALVIWKVPNVSFAVQQPGRSRADHLRALGGSLLALAMPVLILIGILAGIATPTEVSSFAVVYSLLLCALVYRSLSFRQLVRLAIQGAITSGILLFIFSTATIVAWVVTVQQLPQHLTALIVSASNGHGIWLFMLLTIIALVLLGSILEGVPALVVFVPLLFPVAASLGINGIHYGIVMLIAMGIGVFMPPLGVGLYTACAVGRVSIERVSPPLIKYLLVVAAGLLVVAYVPEITLWLPRSFGVIH